MNAVVLDPQALADAQARMMTWREDTGQEAVRHAHNAFRADEIFEQIAREILPALNPAHWFDPSGPWAQWGLGVFPDECVHSHGTVEYLCGQVRQTLDDLVTAHGELVGGEIKRQAGEIWPAFQLALDEMWAVADFCSPGRLLELLRSPGTIGQRFREVEQRVIHAAETVGEFIGYVERLSQREASLIQAFLANLGPGADFLLFGLSPFGAAFAGAAASYLSSSAGRSGEKAALTYVRNHFAIDALSWEHSKKNNTLTPLPSAGIAGQVWSKATPNAKGHFGNVPLSAQGSVAAGSYSGGVGLGRGKDGKLLVGVAAGFTAVSAGVTGTAGSKQLGATNDLQVSAGSVDGFAGVHGNEVGAQVGVDLASVQDTVGANVAGVNVGVSGSIGLKAEFGFEIGQKTEVELPFISFGLSFGAAQ